MTRHLAFSLAVLHALTACKEQATPAQRAPAIATQVPATLPAPTPAPTPTPPAPRCTPETCKGACLDDVCVDTCAVKDVELIYLLDDRATLYSFNPRSLPLDPVHKIAALACDAMTATNSMAVDRYGIAWIGYHNGKVHRASIIDGRCLALGAAPRGAPTTFGMGFVADGRKATTEKLFVAGSDDEDSDDGPRSLAILDTAKTPTTWKRVGTLPKSNEHPELTGTGDGRLFAYFPSPNLGFVQELDRKTAKAMGARWTLQGASDHVIAYAFAHWAGVFYVFTSVAEGTSSVHAIHMKTGKQELLIENLPMQVVGAGVSTCAPLLERAP